ncbi:uncharacterized protein haspin [Seriola aureovittata]|uniref:uncharacterized protein haspin n=1 Tax=Seriola aureovittata TaxID=2871759 RepID=UPI0024BEEB96|nr:uncharacterized protein haspin [Seriola aureovittata]
MKPVKPLILKTYGRQRRHLTAWISPDDRKQAFDSTLSTDGDISVFEPAKPARKRNTRTSAGGRRAARPVKKNTIQCLTEKSWDEENISNEENVIIYSHPHPQPAQQSKKTRGRNSGVVTGRVSRPAKRKAVLCLTEISSDEENISRPSPPCPQLAQQSKTTRKSQLVSVPEVMMRRKGRQVLMTSESEEDSMSALKCPKNSFQMKRDSNVHPRSVGRFVTRRRRGTSAKPKLPKAIVSILNSSDDFTSGGLCSSGILRPSRRRRRFPPAVLLSSAENSMNAAGTSSFATNPLREISINESADHSLGPCPRKPIFCSTPSEGSLSQRPHLKLFPINDKSSTSPSMSVSCIGPTGLHSVEKLQSSLGEQEPDLHHHEEPSGDLLMGPESSNKGSSCSEEAKSHSQSSKTMYGGKFPSLNLLSTDGESSSDFVSAAGGLEWQIEALKEKCLTELCSVQLERLDSVTVTQLCSQTTYSSCLGLSGSVHSQQTNKYSLSVESHQTADLLQSSEVSLNLHLSVTNNTIRDYLQPVSSFESPKQEASVTDCLPSIDYKQSAENSPASVLYDESTHHTESSVQFVMGTQLPATSPVQTLFTEEEVEGIKDKCLAKKCAIHLKQLSQSTVKQLKGFTKQKNARMTYIVRSVNPDADKSKKDHTHDIGGETTEGMMLSVRRSVNSSSPAARTQSSDPETEEKTAVLKTMLKEKCLSDKLSVELKRVTLSQLKEILQLKDKKLESFTVVSDSASDELVEDDHQSENDTNVCDEDTSVKVNTKKRSSTSSEYRIASDKEEVVKSSCNIPSKRRKKSLAPKEKKRRSTSADRPGTTRKACVSGLSVSRWKNKGSASTSSWAGGAKSVDCSINELISMQHKQPREVGTTMNFSTPVRAGPLNLSSLLADFTPSTHTWSRLKAALSVHRKVLLTPRGLHLSDSPGRTALADVSQDLFATPLRTPLHKRLQSQLYHSSLVQHMPVCEDADLSDEEKVCAECFQQQPLPWEECILPHRMKQCVKIGEGTFGEVFSTTNASGDTVALKIIPVEGSEKVNGEDQKTFGEILHEIIISKELSSLKEKQHNQTRGFIGLNDLHCVQGCYPPDFLNAWDTFDQKKGSENDRPDFFEKDQLFIILEFEFGGIDLENSNGTLASIGVAKSILHQVTAALAVAEQELHFEHRDLHWGNVLVKTTRQKKGSFLLNGTAHSLETKGVLVRIIDYSLSRLEIDDLTVSCDISKDEELFLGQGDYQFDIYRLMRQENGNNWNDFHPHTNVLWLHYLCSKLLSMKYRGSGGRGAKDTREELTRFYDNILQYSSATEALHNYPMFQ